MIALSHDRQSSGKVRMVEQLATTVTTLRIKDDHLGHDVELYLVHQFQSLRPIRLAVLLFHLIQPCQQFSILNRTPLYSHHIHHFLKLIDLILPLEKRGPRHKIMEDAPKRPHIHSLPIVPPPQQQLRGAVEQRPDHVGHLPAHKIQLPGHAIVDDLDLIVVGIDIRGVGLRDKVTFFGSKHNVGRLQISMYDITAMKFLYPLQNLLKNLLNRELFLTHYYLIQVCRQPFHHHHWLILTHKGLNHPHQVIPTQNLRDVPLADETNRQANLIQ